VVVSLLAQGGHEAWAAVSLAAAGMQQLDFQEQGLVDRRSRIVFTCSKGLPGVCFTSKEWDEIKEKKSGTVERKVTEDFLPGGPREQTIVYEAPFDRCDRGQDYATVWKEFERRVKL
jgi:hypothetical protein